VRKYQYRVGNETAWHDYVNGNEFVLDGSRLVATAIAAAGSATVRARALDNGGNISDETSATLKYTIAPGPSMTSPANGAENAFPANTPELVVSFKSKINITVPGTVTVAAADGTPVQFAGGAVAPNDTRWDASQSKLTLPFALGEIGLGYGKSYTVTVSGFVNTSDIAMEPPEEIFTFTTIGREARPEAEIDFANERLTGFASSVVYNINGTEYTAAAGGVIPIQAAWLGTTVRIIKPGTAATVDSAAQARAIPARRNAPPVGSGTAGYITGTTTDMEYSDSLTGTYLTCVAENTPVPNGTYYVRYKAGGGEFKSAAASIDVAEQTFTLNADDVAFDTISHGAAQAGAMNIAIHSSGNTAATIASATSLSGDFTIIAGTPSVEAGGTNTSYTVQPAAGLGVGVHTATITVAYDGGRTATAQVSITVREATPNIGIDYAAEQLTGLVRGATYDVNGNSQTASTGRLDIANAWLGTTLSIVKTNANTALNSLAQPLPILARAAPPAAPGTVAAVNEAYAGENGSLIGVGMDMEYRHAGGTWLPGTGDAIPNLAPGDYEVRYKAVTDTSFHSRAVSLTVAASRNYKVTAAVSADTSGVSGKVNTGYLLVTFAHANSASSAVPIAGFAAAPSGTAPGAWVAGDAAVGTVGDNGDADDKTWRVNISPAENGGTATLTIAGWTAANGNAYTVTEIDPSPASFTVYKAMPEAEPEATVDFENERLTGLEAGVKYRLDGAEQTADGSGHIPLGTFIPKADSAESAHSLGIVREGGGASVDSPAQTLPLPKRPVTPEGDIAQPTSKDAPNNTGTVTIKNPIPGAIYEYGKLVESTNTVDIWEAFPAGAPTVLSNLAPGVYYARVKAAVDTSFASDSRSFRVHAFDSVDFGSVYVGYSVGAYGEERGVSKAVALLVKEENDNITGVKWVDSNNIELGTAAIDALPFTLSGSAPWTITPRTGFDPKPDGSAYTARIEVTTDATVGSVSYQPVSFWVHPRATIQGIVQSGIEAKGATGEITIIFERAIDLLYSDITVDGAAVKVAGTGGFAEVNVERTQYKIAVSPLMDCKDGDPIYVRINMGSAHLSAAYHFQNSNGEHEVTGSAPAAIPRAIDSAKAFTPIPGYSTGCVQFTLDHGGYPIDTDAIEADISSVELTVGGAKAAPAYILRVDNDMGYTFRVLITPEWGGAAAISVPGFGIMVPVAVEGDVVMEDKSFSDSVYALSEHGNNYMTGIADARQILPAVNAAPDDHTQVYDAPARSLRLNKEYGDWKVEELYLDGEPYAAYTESGGGALAQIFDNDPVDPSYPDLADYLKVTLPAGWTHDDGAHTLSAVLAPKSGAQTYALFLARVEVTGITPTYALTVTGITGDPDSGRRYPAGAVVPIDGGAQAEGKAFLGWTQDDGDTHKIALPQNYNGTITMPAAPVSLTAHYADRDVAPSASLDYSGETLALANGEYSFNAGNPVTVTGGAYPLDGAWFGGRVTVRSVKNVTFAGGTARVDSLPGYVDVPARGGSPGVVGEDEKFTGLGGKLKYVTDLMEYLPDGGEWTSVPIGNTELTVVPGDYLVRYKAKSDAFASAAADISIAASAVAPVWSVTVTPGTVTFPDAAYGYTSSAVSPVTVTATNTGNQPTGVLAVETDTTDFTLSATAIASIPVGGTAQFTAAPVLGLAADDYTEGITVNGAAMGSATLNFKVTATEISGFETLAKVYAGEATQVFEGFEDESAVNAALMAMGYDEITAYYSGGQTNVEITGWTCASYDKDTADEYDFIATLGDVDDASVQIPVSLDPPTVIVHVDPIHHGIQLDSSGWAFPAAKFDHAPPQTREITITSIGDQATGPLKAELSGGGASAFELPDGIIETIATEGGTQTIAVAPKAGLAVGTYSETLTVSTADSATYTTLRPRTFDLSFAVSPNDITGFEPIEDAEVDYNALEATEIVLPSTVTAILANAPELPIKIPVSWTYGSYDKAVPGDYTFTGTLDFGTLLDDGNYSNPQNFTAVTARVTVSEPINAERPVITRNPVGRGGIVGEENIALAVELAELEQTGGVVEGRWLYGTTNAYAGEEVPGATRPKLTVPTDAPGTLYYWYEVTHTNESGYITGDTSVTIRSGIAAVELRYATLTVTNGTISGTDQNIGEYAAGDTVSITADAPPSGQVFSAWAQTEGIAVALPSAAAGNITMPAGDVAIEAAYGTPQYFPPSQTPTPEQDPEPMPVPTPVPTPAPPPPGAAEIFVDVREDDWFNGDVAFVYGLGLMLGTGDDTFSPQAPITRGMAVTILHRLYQLSAGDGAPDVPPAPAQTFSDVPAGEWYADAVAWAVAEGIVLGVGGSRFEPDREITRQEMTTILYRYANAVGGLPEDPGGEGYGKFADAGDVSDWARESATWAVDTGIVTGRPGNIFDPRGITTRAETAALLRRALQLTINS
jgi:hypothetical protein